MMFEEMKAALETIRLADLNRYQKWQTDYRYDSSTQDAQENYPHFSLYLEPPPNLRQ